MDIYVGDLIDNSRSDTQNANDIPTLSTQSGIFTKDFLRYANFAQDRLQSKITKKFPFAFITYKVVDIVAGTSLYSVPDNLSMNNKIVKVEYSRDGTEANYRRLKPGNPYNPSYRPTQSPTEYNRVDGQVQLMPPPSVAGGTLRIWFIRALDRMELRRGAIDVVTINGSNQITALSLDIATVSAEDAVELAKISTQYLCVNSKAGVVKTYNIPVSAYDPSNGNLTLVGTPELDKGESIAVGDYVTIGRYTTTHSKLTNECERYITEYTNRRVFKRDISVTVDNIDAEVFNMEKDIVENYQVPDLDVKFIPTIDNDIMLDTNTVWGW